MWALDLLLEQYESCQADAAADFFYAIASLPWAGALRSRIMEFALWPTLPLLNGNILVPLRASPSSHIHSQDHFDLLLVIERPYT